MLWVFRDVGIKGLLVPNHSRTGAGHHHRLGLAIQTVSHVFAEVLNDELHLLRHVRGVQCHPLCKRTFGLLATHPFFVIKLFAQMECRFVRHEALKHIQDESLFNRLTHGVAMKRLRHVVFVGFPCEVRWPTKQHQR